jgi:hypothetical protein
MSDLAVTYAGEKPKSAYEYRLLYLEQNPVNRKKYVFFCPYCGIELIGKCIFKDEGEGVAKSPHFAKKNGEEHDGDCPYYNANNTKINEGCKKSFYEKKGVVFPEKFVDPPENEEKIITVNTAISRDAIKKEIKRGSVNLRNRGKIIPKTRICEDLANTWNNIVSESYKLKNKNSWDEIKRNNWVKNELLKMPLVFFNDSINEYSNYYYAFRTPKYIDFSHYKIYNFDGIVKENNDSFVIYNDKIKAIIDKQEFLFYVMLDKNIIKGHYATRISELLSKSSLNNYSVKCFALGKPIKANDKIVLHIEKINRLFIKLKNKTKD